MDGIIDVLAIKITTNPSSADVWCEFEAVISSHGGWFTTFGQSQSSLRSDIYYERRAERG